MGILFCLAGVCCFSAFYLLVDFSQKRQADPFGLNLTTFLAGVLLSVAAAGGIQVNQYPPALLVIGSLIGVTAGFALLGITLAARSGMSISVVNTAVSLSLSLPIVLSLLLYGEAPSARKTVGLAFAVASIYLIQRERK
jgi:drug/metabolite transporter (DMT)-like permease